MHKLHGFSQSGNTYKVALLLEALQQPWTPVHIPFEAFASGVTRTPAWREAQNEMGEVPVLEDGDRKLSQSAAIMLHLAAKHGAYAGGNEDERYEVLRWLFFDNHKFTSAFASYRYMKSFAPTPPDPAVAQWLQGRIDGAFGIVEKHLSGREFMVGAAPTIADMSMCGYLYFPVEESGCAIAARYPAIAAWLQRLPQRLPGWKPPYELLPGTPVPPRW
ncbi:glutathione S-transferase family protein [Paucibacter soli]|uniref:glutathione S-transferase family protein n=1 Tax=Paucibacter soli TaxID=3133433 RepID=UPI0030A14170